MTLHRLAAGLSLFFFLFSSLAAQGEALAAVKQDSVAPQKAAAGTAVEKKATGKDTAEKSALDAMPEWEKRYINDTRVTIEKNIDSLMEGIHSPADMVDSVDTFYRTWEKWAESKLFILNDDRDIDVYGNLYSLQVICRTLFLAATDWNENAQSQDSAKILKKAQWLEQRSRRLAEPVAEIIRNQSYSSYLPRRIEIMQDMLPYVDICYKDRGFARRMK